MLSAALLAALALGATPRQSSGCLPVLTRIELGIELDYAEGTLRATSRLTLRAPADHAVRSVPILLYYALEVESVRGADGSLFGMETGGMETGGMAELGQHSMTGIAYSKGALLFYVLYDLVGHEAFLALVRGVYDEHAQTGATLADWTRTAQSQVEADLAPLFDDWLFGTEASAYLRDGLGREEIVGFYR